MVNRILVTGLCTLHWGRLQYGNVGNYYIVEPLFRLLHKHYPQSEIVTTFQMDDDFIKRENITVVPMEIYYSWCDEDVYNAENDVDVARKYIKSPIGIELTPYLSCIESVDMVINVSGDMWGANAEHVGHNRFFVDCLKMKAAQLMGKKTILYAVTPGPFPEKHRDLALEVFSDFDMVVIREKVSFANLEKWGFPLSNVVWAPCPSFLFDIDSSFQSKWIDIMKRSTKKIVGVTFGGFNMPEGPYDMWPRNDEQYDIFIRAVEHIINDLDCVVYIFSHTNAFDLPPNFKLKNGRDFIILNRLYELLINKNSDYRDSIVLVDEPLLPIQLKTLIGKFYMLVTGRVHASVAATSQCVPTVFMEYDRRVIYSDKMLGFSQQLGLEQFVCIPGNYDRIRDCVDDCFSKNEEIRQHLQIKMRDIKMRADSIVKDFDCDGWKNRMGTGDCICK
ncbi:MAG: polysaccharide pyruvyl transferase family protein [Selenomonadaceae bacterium]|nr:polysaccharide pyruvyl transferase family protein [Selenomonadaceae bacterium]